MSISRDELRKPLPLKKVSFPDGSWVNVRAMSAADYCFCKALPRVEDGVETDENNFRYLASVVARCCVDDKGERYFADDEIGLIMDKGLDFVMSVGLALPNAPSFNLNKSKKKSPTR